VAARRPKSSKALIWSDERARGKVIASQVGSLVNDYLDTVGFAGERLEFLERMQRLAEGIAFWGARMNLTAAPLNAPELAFHIIDSLTPVVLAINEGLLQHAFGPGKQVLDLGSGSGFPGLVLASAAPAIFTLVESRRKKSSFLIVTSAEMNLRNVTVESRRIELPGAPSNPLYENTKDDLRSRFDVIVARGYAPPGVFYRAAGAFLRPGGIAILYANSGQDLALFDAEQNELGEYLELPYSVSRPAGAVERILGVWRRRPTDNDQVPS
jgi:16S rRNA G527 N7-methylase RsmG